MTTFIVDRPSCEEDFEIVDLLQFLQLGLDPVGDIPLDLGRRGARIRRRDHRDLDGEIGILQLAQGKEGRDTGDHQQEHREPGECTIADGELRQLHGVQRPSALDKSHGLTFAKAMDARLDDQAAWRQTSVTLTPPTTGSPSVTSCRCTVLVASFTIQTKLPVASSGEKAAESGTTTPTALACWAISGPGLPRTRPAMPGRMATPGGGVSRSLT